MKTGLWFIGTWAAPLVASAFALVLGAAVAGKGTSAGEAAVMLLIPLQLGFFLAGTVVLWKVSSALPQRWALVLAHALVQLGTVAILGFGTLVVFNR
ncbi:MAG: hypothetical protein H6Q89_1582 [Myxococcaceae bacterium]|nr:hypothetical protein [Myxococcaceae bacterium]